MINAFIAKRQSAGMSGRTVNLDVIVLRNVLRRAIDRWLIPAKSFIDSLKPTRDVTAQKINFPDADISSSRWR